MNLPSHCNDGDIFSFPLIAFNTPNKLVLCGVLDPELELKTSSSWVQLLIVGGACCW